MAAYCGIKSEVMEQKPRTSGKIVALAVWWMVAVLLVLDIVALVDRNIIAVLAPPIQRDLALTDVQMGFALGPAFSVAYVLFGMPFGWAVDRFQRRWVVAVGSTIWSGAMIATSFAMSLTGLAGARAVVCEELRRAGVGRQPGIGRAHPTARASAAHGLG